MANRPAWGAGAPYEECPRFARCSANVCLLDPEAHKRTTLEGEEKCTLGKTRRMRIAARYPELLPNKGLRPRELAWLRRWEAMSPEEREMQRQKGVVLAEARILRASQKTAGEDPHGT